MSIPLARTRASRSCWLIAVILSIGLNCSVQAGPLCAGCGRDIGDATWVRVGDEVFHKDHFLCHWCNGVIRTSKFFEQDGEQYDGACYAEYLADRCDYCGGPILGESVIALVGMFHPNCYQDFVAAQCLICGQPISGQYLVDAYGDAICADHQQQVTQCDVCQRFTGSGLNSGAYRHMDGRVSCATCMKTAVMKQDQASMIMDEVIMELSALDIDIDKQVDLDLVSRHELNRLSENPPSDMLGVTRFRREKLRTGRWSFTDFRISILYGLPRARFRSVVAHELMHVWLSSHGPADLDRQLCEGSCEYVSYLILLNDDSDQSRLFQKLILQNDDQVYGEGFRLVRQLIETWSCQQWLKSLRASPDPPWAATD